VVFRAHQAVILAYLEARAIDINVRDPDPLPADSVMEKVLSAPGNKEIFVDRLPPRNIEVCLIIMENLTSAQIAVMRNAFDNQTYKNWKLVIPSESS
jgi:hypothetical protein